MNPFAASAAACGVLRVPAASFAAAAATASVRTSGAWRTEANSVASPADGANELDPVAGSLASDDLAATRGAGPAADGTTGRCPRD
ncbi:hypothetical protein FTUN_5613 [Frigoriglobus tundricola]|uniref:Secreted protein n=1 Tax=Frigoriglobus tundricola TaxID=2774151 RepID=A0A6M5YXU9_9BACT|nr:hypothetical protein FTUN_5613 [Frigoriglobus tundricola]